MNKTFMMWNWNEQVEKVINELKKKTELNSSIKFARDKIKKAAKRGVATEVRNAENVNRNLKTYSVKFGWEHEKK